MLQFYCANWGYVFFTEDSLAGDGNPWDELSTYFTTFLEAVEKAPGSAGECDTLAPTAPPAVAPTLAPIPEATPGPASISEPPEATPEPTPAPASISEPPEATPEPTAAPASIFEPPEATPAPTAESTDTPGPVQVDLVPCILAAQDVVSARRAFGDDWSLPDRFGVFYAHILLLFAPWRSRARSLQ